MSEVDFAILGAGALGSILGGHLARAGHRVVMLARQGRAQQIESNGIRIKGLVDFSVPVATLRDPSQLRGAKTLIVAMKTPGTRQALEPLRRAHIGVAFSVQNGLLKNELLGAAFGPKHVLGCLADTSGELLPDGEVLFTRNVNLFVGELSGEESPRAREIARMIDTAGVRTAAMPDILTLEWSKFVPWVGLMALSVVTRARTGRYLTDPDAAILVVRLVREVGALARARGIRLTDRSVLPAASLCEVSEQQAVETVRAIGREFESNAPQHRMSALQDLEAGRPLEAEDTLGHALRLASESGLQLPLLEAFRRLLASIDRTRNA